MVLIFIAALLLATMVTIVLVLAIGLGRGDRIETTGWLTLSQPSAEGTLGSRFAGGGAMAAGLLEDRFVEPR